VITFDRNPPTIEYRGRPILRVMWLGRWDRPQFGDGSYYGWRWWLGLGPLLILMGMARDDMP
jgi:hypothetical protein